MANNVAAIVLDLFSVGKEVAAEPYKMIQSINMNFDSKGASVGQAIDVPVHPVTSAKDYVPAMVTTKGDDTVAGVTKVTITKNRMVDRNLTGEELNSLENTGTAPEWAKQWIKQTMRTLRNEIEAAIALEAANNASRVAGTPGTTPFASDINTIVDVKTILRTNGSPIADAHLAFDSMAASKLQKLGIYQNEYQAGSDYERRTGTYKDQFGLQLGDTAGIFPHVCGTGSAYILNGAHAKGATTITVKTGAGTILIGDIVTINGVMYVVTSTLSGSTFTISAPGLVAAGSDSQAVTLNTTTFTPNVGFERQAIVGVVRPPIIPPNPLIQQVLLPDPSGLTYLLCQVAGDGMTTWRLHVAYGFKAVNPEFIGLMAG